MGYNGFNQTVMDAWMEEEVWAVSQRNTELILSV